jgi:putative transposase
MKKAWDTALSNEGLMGITGAPQMPTALSDHGVQMAKKSGKQSFKDLRIKQLFARYQTPKDNAWIESWFRILTYDWLQYKDSVSFDEVKEIIRQFVIIYNTQRYHGALGSVTPEQKHSGQAEEILKARSERKRLACLHRLKINREQVSQPELAQAA